uniref:G_PROTEIN_RECEP_F1_2 domain-containing protein n=1 Tax=Caenorhabditis tropicalis TaxID=1561998 RepID=A0A1I7V2L6_9PELO
MSLKIRSLTRKCIDIEFYIAIIGIILTVFHVYILTRKQMLKSSIISIMIGIGIFDICSMVLAISVRDLISSFYRDVCTPPLTLFLYRLFWILMTLRDHVIRCSTWLGILMAFIRFLVIRFNLRPTFKKVANVSFGFYSTAFIFVISSLIAILNYSRTKIVEVGVWHPAATCESKSSAIWLDHELRSPEFYTANDGFLLRVTVFINGFLSRIIPCVLLPTLTIMLILEIRRARKKMANSRFNFPKKADRTTTLVMIMTVTFSIASLPAGIFTLFQVMYTDVGFFHLSNFVEHFSNAILTAMASVHCVICFSMSSEYRRTVKEVLGLQPKQIYSNSIF